MRQRAAGEKPYLPRGLARLVGSARTGSSGQTCFGYRPRMSARTSAQEPRQKRGRSAVVWIGRWAGESSSSVSGALPAAIGGC